MSTTEVALGARLRIAIAEPDNWRELFRFAVVGISGYTINLVTFAVLVHPARVPYAMAAVISFLTGLSVTFILNRRWTFQAHEGIAHHQAARFVAVSTVGFLVGLGLLTLLVETHAMPKVGAQAIAAAAVAPLTFVLNKLWTFAA